MEPRPNSYAIYTRSDTGLVSKNNILANNAGGYVIQTYEASNYSEADYNSFYTTATNRFAVMSGNQAYSTYAAYVTASGHEQNSLQVNPQFTSNTDLHTSAPGLNNAGVGVGISDDYDGEARNTTTPDIGADEFYTSGLYFIISR